MVISIPYPTFKRGWQKDYAAAGLCDFCLGRCWTGCWGSKLVSSSARLDLQQAVANPQFTWQAYVLSGSNFGCGSNTTKISYIMISIIYHLRKNSPNCPTHDTTKATAVVGEARRQRQAHFLSLAPRESHPPAP